MVDTTVLQPASQASYEVHISVFEGPLALLLKLIEKNELDITEIALAQVTDEFMDHVERMRANMEIEVVADFLFVAAKLLWIKSRALLPKSPVPSNGQEEEEDVGDELIRQLRAYRQYKEAAEWLRQRDHQDCRAYVRGGYKPRPKHVTIDLAGVTLEIIRAHATAALFPAETPRPEGAIQRPRLSIVQQVALIRRRLTRWSRVSFRRLLSRTPSRLEAVVTLQAVLELMKQRTVAATQMEMFGDITIEATVPVERVDVTSTVPESPATEPVS